jgi:hypothetical protein
LGIYQFSAAGGAGTLGLGPVQNVTNWPAELRRDRLLTAAMDSGGNSSHLGVNCCRGMSLKTMVISIVCSVLIPAIPAVACSAVACAGRGNEVHPSFAVKISQNGSPLAGVIVDVTTQDGKSKQFSGVSGLDGTVDVTNLPMGDYWLDAEYLGVSAAYQCFHVENHPTRKAKKHLTFSWGDYAAGTRQVAGKIIDSQPGEGGTRLSNMTHRVEVPIRGASIKLTAVMTGIVYTVISDERGEFAFSTVPKGKYVLHIDGEGVKSGRSYDAADFVIEVSAKAQYDAILLTNREAGGGSCGGISLDLRRSGK